MTCFTLVSSLKIKMQKSEIILAREMEDVDRATSPFGCKVGKLPTYLSLPLGAPSQALWCVGFNRGEV